MLRQAAPRTLTLVAVGLLLCGPLSAQQFGKNRIQYREFDWQIYHSPHFDIYYNESEEHLLQKTASFAESAYDELSRAFDFQIQEPTPLIVYATHSAFQQTNVIVNGVPEGAGAFATPSRFRMVMPLDLPDPELIALIKHELTHIFQYHILFRGKLGAGLRSAPPTWFMEGMASYFADDETPADRMFMVDAVVNDNIPSVETLGGGFFAYRFGHAVFDFIEERWGREGVLDLVYEFRNTVGSRIGRAIERSFRVDVEDFDAEFRRWARRKYLPELITTGEPADFGRPFRLGEGVGDGQELSPAASPSGDLVAAVTTDRQQVDISIFDAVRRRRLRVITPGYETQIREIVVQLLTAARSTGRDLSFSPDGNQVAVFVRREAGRSLALIDVLDGGIAKIVDMQIEQQLSPIWSPDGRTIAFSGNIDGRFDIFLLDLESLEIINLTEDEMHDESPAFSPDGRWLAYTSYVGEQAQLFQLDLADPSRRFQLTSGDWSSKEPVYSPSGKRIYYTSDRTGADNIFALDLESSTVTQYTNAVTGCDRPAVLSRPDGTEELVYTGYWNGSFDLYVTEVEEPLGTPEPVVISSLPVAMGELEVYEPSIEVAINEENIEEYGGFKFFLEDAVNFLGIDSNQLFVGRVLLSFSDFLGDRRIFANLAAVDTISDFDVTYFDLRKRQQWGVRLFDTRYYAPFFNEVTGELIDRIEIFSITGGQYIRVFPINFSNRFEIAAGYYLREYNVPLPGIPAVSDDFPQLDAAFVSDTAIYNAWGPIVGHRLRLSANYAPDLDESGTLNSVVELDARQYIPLTRRSNVALRFYGAATNGNRPYTLFVGGLDTIRGVRFRGLSGDRAFYANVELRFPLIDQLAFPGFRLGGIRGVLFFDLGSAYFSDSTDFDLYDSENGRLEDAIAAYGYGLSVGLFGMTMNWDFAKVTDLDTSADGFETSFWIGTRF